MRWLSLCFVLFASAASVAADEVPLADFARHAQYHDVRISPDGEYLAASAGVGGKTVLALIRLKDMRGVNVVPRDTAELASFRWVGPHRLMYTEGERAGGLEQPLPTGELFVVNGDGTDDRILFGLRAGGPAAATHIARAAPERAFGTLIAPLRDDERHALIASYPFNDSHSGVFPEAYRIDLETGLKLRVASSPLRNAHFLADNAGHVRFAYGTDVDQREKVYFRAGDEADWEKVFDEASDGRPLQPLRFARDDRSVYFACGGICRFDVATRELTPVWQVEGVDPVDLMPTFDERDAFAVRSEPARPAVTLLDKSAPEAKLLVGLMQQFPGEAVEFRSATPDGSKVVVLVYSDTDPGQFFLYDAASRKATFLFARRPWIAPERMAPMAPIELAARDGLPLHGYLTRPPGKAEAKNLPLVVLVHGGPYGARDRWDFDPDVQALASHGYAVLQVNYRGSGGYGAAFQRAGYREWGGKMQDDVTDATRWAIAQGVADPKRIGIFGGSYGGYAALEGAVKEPELYRCAIGYVGVYDLRLMYRRGDIAQNLFGENYLKLVLGEDMEQLAARSPIAGLDRLKAKVMLIVGGADPRVPPVHGENLHAELSKRRIEHEWLYESKEGHGFYNEKNRETLYRRVLAFLDRTLGEGAPR
jgi:dipeptidyl aminopeptidase/acylaminoacyl peptidase